MSTSMLTKQSSLTHDDHLPRLVSSQALIKLLSYVLPLIILSQTGWAQERKPIRALDPIPFSSVAQESISQGVSSQEEASSERALALFNLLRLRGATQELEGASVEVKFTLDEQQYGRLLERSSSGEDLGDLRLPPLDYEEVGTLRSMRSLVNPVWVLWVPSSLKQLNVEQVTYIKRVLGVLAVKASPKDQLYIYTQQSYPRLLMSLSNPTRPNLVEEVGAKISEASLKARSLKSRSRARSQALSPAEVNRWAPKTRNLSELLGAIHFQRLHEVSAHPQGLDYQCGLACSHVVPQLRILILHQRGAPLFAEAPDAHLRTLLSSLHQPQHTLFGARFFLLSAQTDQGETDQARGGRQLPPQWIQPFLTRAEDSTSHRREMTTLDHLQSEIDLLNQEQDHLYYVIPPISLHPHFWSKKRDHISLRITLGDQSFVRHGSIISPPEENDYTKAQREKVIKRYYKKLAKVEPSKSSQLSALTRVFIAILWVILGGVALVLAVLLIRRDRHLSSDPLVTKLESVTELLEEGVAEDSSLQHTASSSQRLPTHDTSSKRSLDDPYDRREPVYTKRSQPSDVSPMVDPEQPSTVPAPAAESRESQRPIATELSHDLVDTSHPIDLPRSTLHPLLEDSSSPSPLISDSFPRPLTYTDELHALSLEVETPQQALSPPIPATSTSSHLHIQRGLHRSEYLESIPELSIEPAQSAVQAQKSSRAELQHSRSSTPLSPLAGLYAESGPMHKLLFLVFQSPSTVGRDPETECPLPPSGPRSDRKVSREHFMISRLDDQRWEVRCISHQGLMINDLSLSYGETALLRDQDVVILGVSHLRFRCSEHWREHRLTSHIKQGHLDA